MSTTTTTTTTTSHVHKLATVEIQLILNWLDVPSRLRAARSSKLWFKTIQGRIVWRNTPPMQVCPTQNWFKAKPREINTYLQRFRTFSAQSLLRFIPLDLQVDVASSFDWNLVHALNLATLRLCHKRSLFVWLDPAFIKVGLPAVRFLRIESSFTLEENLAQVALVSPRLLATLECIYMELGALRQASHVTMSLNLANAFASMPQLSRIVYCSAESCETLLLAALHAPRLHTFCIVASLDMASFWGDFEVTVTGVDIALRNHPSLHIEIELSKQLKFTLKTLACIDRLVAVDSKRVTVSDGIQPSDDS